MIENSETAKWIKKMEQPVPKQRHFKSLPPREFILPLMDKFLQIYIYLWDRRDTNNIVALTWKDIFWDHNKNTFRTAIRKLHSKKLLQYEETQDGIIVELLTKDLI